MNKKRLKLTTETDIFLLFSFVHIFLYLCPPPKITSYTMCTWTVYLLESDRYSKGRPCHGIPYLTQSPTSSKTIRKWRTEVQDSANPSFVTGALGLMVISRPMGFSSVHTPMVWDLWGAKCLQTWKLLKDGWMSGIQGCLEKRPEHQESQSEDKKTWSAKRGI